MKRIIILASLLLFVANQASAAELGSGTASNAAISIFGGVNADAAAAAPTALIRFSTGVNGLAYFDNTAYLISTKHTTGSKMFATTNTVTNIYWKQAANGALDSTMLGVSDYAASNLVGNGWTSY